MLQNDHFLLELLGEGVYSRLSFPVQVETFGQHGLGVILYLCIQLLEPVANLLRLSFKLMAIG